MHHREPIDSEARRPLLPSSRLSEKTPVGMLTDQNSEAIDKFPLRMGPGSQTCTAELTLT